MRVLDLIISAIRFGVMLLRARVETLVLGPMTDAEVEAVLVEAAKSAPDATDWRNSIVDLMKILHLDPSKSARAELWDDTGHVGHFTGSAEQNIELHRVVMKEVAHRLVIGPADRG